MSNELMRPTDNSALTIPQLVQNMETLRDVMRQAMKPDQDYGQIPGTNSKPTLLKPGAEKLALMFRYAPGFEETITELSGEHREYQVKCRLTHIPTGNFVGEASAVCSTRESKYRWRSGTHTCPQCQKPAIIKGKAEYGGGWICYGKKGGCGAKFPDNQFGAVERVENPDIADQYNTVKQIAQKRAFLAAIKTATASSELFTIDIGDPEDDSHGHHEPAPENRTATAPVNPPAQPAATNYPPCPNCGGPMKVKKKKNGEPFLGCPKKNADGSWCNGAIWDMPATGEESQVAPEQPQGQQSAKPPKGCERFENQLRGILNDIGCKDANDAQAVISHVCAGLTLEGVKQFDHECEKVVSAIEGLCTFGATYEDLYNEAIGKAVTA